MMSELFWLLLLPAAAAVGWYAATRLRVRQERKRDRILSGEYFRGLNFLLSEQADRALEVFIHMVDLDSETIETHLILGNLFRRRGEVDRAIRIHQNIIARPSLSTEQRASALLELGRDYFKAGVYDRAETVFRQIADAGEMKADAYGHLRVIYEQEKDWERSIWVAGCEQTVSGRNQAAHVAHYHCEMGEMALNGGDLSRAAAMARKALSVQHGFIRAELLLGDIAARKEDWREAISRYTEALDQNIDLAMLVLPRLREAHLHLDDLSGYERQLTKRLETHHSAALIQAFAQILAHDSRVDELCTLIQTELAGEHIPLSVIALLAKAVRDGEPGSENGREALAAAIFSLERQAEEHAIYRCVRCGFEARGHFWRCPGCHCWGTIKPIEAHEETGDDRVSLHT